MLAPKVTAATSAVTATAALAITDRTDTAVEPLPGASAKRRPTAAVGGRLAAPSARPRPRVPRPTARGAGRGAVLAPRHDDRSPRARRPSRRARTTAEHRPVGVEAGADLDPPHRADRHRRRRQHRADRPRAARRRRPRSRGRSTDAPAIWCRVGAERRGDCLRPLAVTADVPAERLADQDEAREPDDDPERSPRASDTGRHRLHAHGRCRST